VLKKNRKAQHIPIIFLTTLYLEEEVQRGRELGAEDFISKPVSSLQLASKIAACFSLDAAARA
jgi:response regulator RpfG family c-di-GMP phosphodiesterase